MNADIGPLAEIDTFLKGREYYSFSSIRNFQACRRLFYYQKELRLGSSRNYPNAAFGSVIHLALASLHKTASIEAMLERYHRAYDEQFALFNPEKLETRFTRPVGEDILLCYIRAWRWRPWYCRPDMVEAGLVVEIPGLDGEPPFLYVMRIDMIDERWNQFMVVDIKTAGSMSDRFAQQFNPDQQTRGYVYGVRRLAGDRACSKVTIDGILVQATNRQFLRPEIEVTGLDIAEWEHEIKEWVSEIRRAREKGLWMQSTKECNSFGRCAFDSLCLTHMAPSVVQNMPRRSDADPLHLGD